MTNPERLLQFHFGSIDDHSRLALERELLSDTETLLDYLDLKRSLEAAVPIPQHPPERLWRRLSARLEGRSKVLTLSFGLALAASLLLCLFLFNRPRSAPPLSTSTQADAPAHGILIDAPHEPSADSGVL
jgi:hypothetical protein